MAAVLLVSACGLDVRGGAASGLLAESYAAKAEREFVVPLALLGGQELTAAVRTGAIAASAGSSAEPQARVRLVLRARTEEEARTALERFDVVAQPSDQGLELAVRGEPLTIEEGLVRHELHPSADCTLVLPPDVALDLSSGAGALSVEGAAGACDLSTDYGSISVDGARGSLLAETRSGNVRVANVAGEVEVRTSYGSVEVSDVDGQRVELASASGDVSLRDSRASRLTVRSDYGRITLSNVSGDLEARSSSGDVSGAKLEGARIVLASSYGKVALVGAKGVLELQSGSGDVLVDEAQGALNASTNYGAVEARGVWSAVTASSRSGAVAVRSLAGSKLTSAWELTSGYGDVELFVPDEFTCALDATTDYGSVTSEFSLTIEAGAAAKDGRLIGVVGGGGPKVKLHSKSGDVFLRKQPNR